MPARSIAVSSARRRARPRALQLPGRALHPRCSCQALQFVNVCSLHVPSDVAASSSDARCSVLAAGSSAQPSSLRDTSARNVKSRQRIGIGSRVWDRYRMGLGPRKARRKDHSLAQLGRKVVSYHNEIDCDVVRLSWSNGGARVGYTTAKSSLLG